MDGVLPFDLVRFTRYIVRWEGAAEVCRYAAQVSLIQKRGRTCDKNSLLGFHIDGSLDASLQFQKKKKKPLV